jgi:hypothetical protein
VAATDLDDRVYECVQQMEGGLGPGDARVAMNQLIYQLLLDPGRHVEVDDGVAELSG